jgi:hypothetical protein
MKPFLWKWVNKKTIREKLNEQTWVIKIFAVIGGIAVLNLSFQTFAGQASFFYDHLTRNQTEVVFISPASATELDPSDETQENVESDHRENQGPQNAILSLDDKIRQAFPEDPETAVAIAKAESQLVPDKIGDKHLIYYEGDEIYGDSIGVFQIRMFPERKVTREELKNVDVNIEWARKLYDERGWQPWSAYTSGSYLKYL